MLSTLTWSEESPIVFYRCWSKNTCRLAGSDWSGSDSCRGNVQFGRSDSHHLYDDFRLAGIFDISVYAFSGYTLIVPIMAFGLFWQRSTAVGILMGSVAGHGLLASYYLGWRFPTFWMFPVFVCLIVESVAIAG